MNDQNVLPLPAHRPYKDARDQETYNIGHAIKYPQGCKGACSTFDRQRAAAVAR